MNHCVPDFDIDNDHHLYGFTSSRKPNLVQEDEVMELLWQNGQVVMHRPYKQKAAVNSGGGSSTPPVAAADAPQLFIQEDEMASWLHYPLDDEPQFDRDFCSDLLFPPPTSAAAGSCTDTAVTDPVQLSRERDRPNPRPKPPVPPTRRADNDCRPHQGFGHFSRFRPRQEPPAGSAAPKVFNSNQAASETVVESNATPVATAAANAGFVAGSLSVGGDGVLETTSLNFTVESSSGASGAEPVRLSACSDNKRKGRQVDEHDCHSKDVVIKAVDTKKQVHGSTTKRTRAAEVHNLSERRRRDRINEKMKALQELIPRCNKSDKASMLDDAIEYLKSLQMQVQMMSMGCGMVQMMFPGMQQYMQPMGMGMGMGVDVNRPMMPFPMATPTHMGSGFPEPSYHPIPPFVSPDSSRIQVNNRGSLLNPVGTQNVYQQPVQAIPDQYQQYLGSHTMQQMQPPQNDATSLPVTSKTIPSGGPEILEPRPLPG